MNNFLLYFVLIFCFKSLNRVSHLSLAVLNLKRVRNVLWIRDFSISIELFFYSVQDIRILVLLMWRKVVNNRKNGYFFGMHKLQDGLIVWKAKITERFLKSILPQNFDFLLEDVPVVKI